MKNKNANNSTNGLDNDVLCDSCKDYAQYLEKTADKKFDIYYCKHCGAKYYTDNSQNTIYLEGEKRDWVVYLNSKLQFPFEVEVREYQEMDSLIQTDDILKVHRIAGDDDLYGIILEVRKGRKKFHFPLCDVDVTDKKSMNYTICNEYIPWFGNSR